MAIPLPAKTAPLRDYRWQGADTTGKPMRGVMRTSSAAMVAVLLRRRHIRVGRIAATGTRSGLPGLYGLRDAFGKRVAKKDITLLTRQLATILEAGIPLLQALGIVAESHGNAAVVRLVQAIQADIETGTGLAPALAAFPTHFDALYLGLVAAGEQTGLLDTLLARLADYRERDAALKSRLRTVLIYPMAIIVTAILVTVVIMIWVVPAFRTVFASFGAELPAATLAVIALSDWLVRYWLAAALAGMVGAILCFHYWKRSITMQRMVDRLLLTLPLFGPLLRHACTARWARTLATMFAAGLPLASSLESIGRTAGNSVFLEASRAIRADLESGSSLARAIGNSRRFPPMVAQMAAIGEESGTLDRMLGKTADFYEARVNQSVATLSALVEPCIMLVLGSLVGALVIALYLPIFQLGAVV